MELVFLYSFYIENGNPSYLNIFKGIAKWKDSFELVDETNVLVCVMDVIHFQLSRDDGDDNFEKWSIIYQQVYHRLCNSPDK